MTKKAKRAKQDAISKQKASTAKRENDNELNPDEFISKITEDTLILKGIISRFSKPVSEEDKQE